MGHSYCHYFIIVYVYRKNPYGRYAGGFVIERSFNFHYPPILPGEEKELLKSPQPEKKPIV